MLIVEIYMTRNKELVFFLISNLLTHFYIKCSINYNLFTYSHGDSVFYYISFFW